ncbi:anti-sigma-D factor RsdA [Nocardia alni]|uniref:anti-sigma-D factor RsdA n=1 Tax=Nocardia alni TaxID=2815723 RepID=UPI001C24F43E|nr:anti-sigma-D factor RsdA [Nocardia alni]
MARDGGRGRGDWRARHGSQKSGPYAEDSGDAGPVDIVAVRRDDALIDAIAGAGSVETDSAQEFQLATLLASWRADIVDEPMPAGPDLDEIVAAVNQEIAARQTRVTANRRGRLRLVRPLMGAAAMLALIAGGMTAFSYSAQPGDPLWKVKEVVFSEQAQTTIANTANDQVAQAQNLVQQDPEQAKKLLANAANTGSQLSDDNRKQALGSHWVEVWSSLHAVAPQIANQLLPPSATSTPATPPRVDTRSGGQRASGTVSPSANPVRPSAVPPITLPGGIPIPTMPTVPTVPSTITLPGGITIPVHPGPSSAKRQPPTTAAPPPSAGHTAEQSPHNPGTPGKPLLPPAVASILPTLPPAGPLPFLPNNK